ncbi:hypothetical protein C8Q76DRAFT_716268 [Earliella scabrosa]|nr:hypothetical protein C8Q76DRAFT_716268 [Earliella scabrosa]
MRVYAIACLLSLEEEARIAAQAVREQKAEGTYADELEDLPIGPYQRLLHYCAIAQASVPEGGFCCPARGHPGVLVEPGVSSDASVTLSSSIASIRIIYPAGADDTDVFVDTSDGHQVCVHRTLLRYSSPVLYAMLTQSPSTTSTSISVPETSRIMLILFHICGPLDTPYCTDLLEMHAALVAARKYHVVKAIHFLQHAIRSRQDRLVQEDAVLLYAVASHLGLDDVARFAAKQSIWVNISLTTPCASIDAIPLSARHFYRLLDYQKRCRTAICSIAEGREWIAPSWVQQFNQLCRKAYAPCWYESYIETIFASNSRPTPTHLWIIEKMLAYSGSSCGECADKSKGAVLLFKFSFYVAEVVDKLENEVAF